MRRRALALIVSVALSTGIADAHGFEVGALTIGHPWTLAVPPAAPAAAYLTITNRSDRVDRLVGAESPLAGRVELHTISVEDGVARMRPLPDGIEVAPGATVALQPGGTHLMMLDRSADWAATGRIPLTLDFAVAGPVEVQLAIHTAADAPAPIDEHANH